MTLYRTTHNSAEIEAFEIDRSTDHNVWFTANLWGKTRQHMEARTSGWHNWHNTRDEAVKFLMDKLQDKKESNERERVRIMKDIETLCSSK